MSSVREDWVGGQKTKPIQKGPVCHSAGLSGLMDLQGEFSRKHVTLAKPSR